MTDKHYDKATFLKKKKEEEKKRNKINDGFVKSKLYC